MDTGLMKPQPNRPTTTSSPLLEQFRAVLSPTGGSPRTLEDKLAALSDTELNSIMQTAKFVRSNAEYNPSDELGTSLQDYYDKFAVQS